MTARSALQSSTSTDLDSALVFEPPDQIEGGTGLYHTVLRCGLDLERRNASQAGTRQVNPSSVRAHDSRKSARRR